MLEFRDRIIDAAIIDWILGSLEATWLFQHQFEQQITFFSNYLRLHPGDSGAHRARAAAFWYSDRLNDSVSDYSRAIELNPTDILSRSGRGQVLAELGDNASAMQDLDVALRLLDSVSKTNEIQREWCVDVEAFVRRGRGVALAASGDIGEGMDEFAKSIRLSPESAWAYYSRARIYDRQGGHRRALSDYSEAMKKTKPPLSPLQGERVRVRIVELSRAPD